MKKLNFLSIFTFLLLISLNIMAQEVEDSILSACDPSTENCGYQDVESYIQNSESLFSSSFVNKAETSVGIFVFFDPNNDVALRYDKTLHKIFDINEDFIADKESPELINYLTCSGTMISSNLYLTAAHCINASLLYEDSSWGAYKYANPDLINEDQFPPFAYVFFDYQDKKDHHLRERVVYAVKSVVEVGDIYSDDYAILELYDIPLRNEPFYYYDNENVFSRAGINHKFKKIEKKPLDIDNDIAVIGYPLSYPEVVSTGKVTKSDHDEDYYFNHSADIYSGNSGSGILNTDGNIAGICHSIMGKVNGKPSLDIKISYIVEQSDILSGRTDNDGDGIPFLDDKCPSIYDPNQEDWNNNGIGDACEDSNSNGILDKYEKMFVKAPAKREIFSAKCKLGSKKVGDRTVCTTEGDGGAFYNSKTWKNTRYNPETENYEWIPDHNLDGITDLKDLIFKYVTIGSWPQTKVTMLMPTANTLRTRFETSPKIWIVQNRPEGFTTADNVGEIETSIDNRYCWYKTAEADKNWGKDGYCTTSDNKSYIKKNEETPSFGYSHGSDPHPADDTGKISWKESTKYSDFKPVEGSEPIDTPVMDPVLRSASSQEGKKTTIYPWDWFSDLAKENYDVYYNKIGQYLENPSTEVSGTDFIRYAFSSGYKSKAADEGNEDYTITVKDSEGNDLVTVNPAYFYANATYARASRDKKAGTDLSYSRVISETELPDPRDFETSLIDDIPVKGEEMIFPPWERGGLGCIMDNYFTKDSLNVINYVSGNGVSYIQSEKMPFNGKGVLIKDEDGSFHKTEIVQNIYAYTWFNDSAYRNEWQIENIIRLHDKIIEFQSAARAGGITYLATNRKLYKTVKDNASTTEVPVYDLEEITSMPNMTEPVLFTMENALYIMGNENSKIAIYKKSGETLTKIESAEAPDYRTNINYTVSGDTLYIAGGGIYSVEEIEMRNDIWKFNETQGFTKLADNVETDMLKLYMQTDETNLYMVNTRTVRNNSTKLTTLNLETGVITVGTIPVTGWINSIEYEKDYCIYETGGNIYSGILNEGSCTKLSDYNYDSHTYFDYKKTVAGWNNHLYLGGLSGIREITIEDDGDLNKEKLHWLGSINNIAVKDNYLYGAGGSKIEILKIESDGSLTEKNAISTSSCDNIRIYENYLIAGEKKKVTIWNISNLENPSKVKTISVKYPVKDIETAGSYLYVYHDKTFRTGKLALYEISDILNPIKKDEEKKECNDPELTVSGETVYMGCKNGQYKVVNNNGSLNLEKMSGEKNYMRDSYYYNGIVYQVFSGKLHESK